MNLIFASSNEGKVREMKKILGDQIDIISKSEAGYSDFDTIEDSDSLLGNARKKAIELSELCKKSVFSDDSGLFIESLNNKPGVYSARYFELEGYKKDNLTKTDIDKLNIDLILESMKDKENKNAFFKTIIYLRLYKKVDRYFEGIVKGKIIDRPKGVNGFGYDSIFVPEGSTLTYAEMTETQKNKFSHRKIALEKMRKYLIENKYIKSNGIFWN